MSEEMSEPGAGWAPRECTLPTAERPLRGAEFDDLFATALRNAERWSFTALNLELDPTPAVAARAADLMVRETGCCSFFDFTLTAGSGRLALAVSVPSAHADVLDSLAERAVAAAGSAR